MLLVGGEPRDNIFVYEHTSNQIESLILRIVNYYTVLQRSIACFTAINAKLDTGAITLIPEIYIYYCSIVAEIYWCGTLRVTWILIITGNIKIVLKCES